MAARIGVYFISLHFTANRSLTPKDQRVKSAIVEGAVSVVAHRHAGHFFNSALIPDIAIDHELTDRVVDFCQLRMEFLINARDIQRRPR